MSSYLMICFTPRTIHRCDICKVKAIFSINSLIAILKWQIQIFDLANLVLQDLKGYLVATMIIVIITDKICLLTWYLGLLNRITVRTIWFLRFLLCSAVLIFPIGVQTKVEFYAVELLILLYKFWCRKGFRIEI